MPTPVTTDLPPPSNWDEFEIICADLWGEIWGDRHTQLYGRQGQRQNGVDIKGVDNKGKQCGAQCKGKKNWPPSKLTIKEIDSEIAKAKKFRPELNEFILLTTASNDVTVQDHVAALNKSKSSDIGFRVEVYSWDEIRRRLSNYPELLQKHYPKIFRKPVAAEVFDRELQNNLNKIVSARYFGGFDTEQNALQLSERLTHGDLLDASPSTRMAGLAWCARLLSVSNREVAQSVLAAAKTLGTCEEIAIADAFLTSAEGKVSDALASLNRIDTSETRSAAFIIQLNHAGPSDALRWSAEAGYGWKDYDNGGRTRLILAASETGNWSLLESCLEALGSANESLPPALASVSARASLQLALPEEMRASLDHTPPFFAREFRLSSAVRADGYRDQAIKLFQIAAKELHAIGLDGSALIQEDFELWLKLSATNSREDAKKELREQLKDRALRMRRANLALQFGVEIDRDQLMKELDQEIARSGGGNIDTGCTALAIALTASSPKSALSEFRKRRVTIERAISEENLLGIEIELLARTEMGVEARHLLTNKRELLSDGKVDDLDRMIRVAEGADPSALLRAQYEVDNNLQTLAHLVDELFDSQAWQTCHRYSAELFKRTESFVDAKRYIRVLTETKRFSDAVGVLDAHPHLLEDRELRKVFSWSLYEIGEVVRSIEIAEGMLSKEHDPELSRMLTNAYVAKGDWEKLPQQIEDSWDNRVQLSAQELLQAAQLAQITGHSREKELVRAAVAKSETDGFAFAGAYFLASKGGWEESGEVATWLHKAISLSDDDGPMYRADLREIVDKQLGWNEHATRTVDMLRASQCPIFMAAEALNRHLVDFTISRSEANKCEDRRANVMAIPSFSGKRQPFSIDETDVGLDATSLMTLQSLDMLDAVFEHFEQVKLPHSTMGWLLEEISEVRYHQPSRIERAEALRQLILDGKVKVCSVHPFRVTKLEQEIGDELAALVGNADSDRSKGGLAFVVRGFPISKVGSLGDETANLSGWDHLFVSTSSVVEFLHQEGRISSSIRDTALEYLALQEASWPEEGVLNSDCNCYLDDLTISHLQHLNLLDLFCGCGVNAMIDETTQAEAMGLRKYEQHLSKVEASLVELRQTLSREVSSGRVAVLANDRGEDSPDDDRRLWSHPTMSVFGSMTSPDAIVVDDRFLNRHATADRHDGRSTVYSTLDILKTLQTSKKIADDDYFRALNDLRQRGHLFVPIELEELRAYVGEASMKEGQLRVGRNLLQVQAYYLFARFSECLTVPDDVHWLLQSNRIVNDVIREQWKGAKDLQCSRAISSWLFDLVDLRLWTGDNGPTVQDSGVEGLLIANIVGLLATPEDASKEEREAYLTWLDEDIVQPLKNRHPEVFQKIVSYSKDLMENMLAAQKRTVDA
ncbi:hypothetical protein AB0T83_14595 [Fluviibacterium sp. DFM31]|uniref:HTH domain-containing protein n=1 Tax=Meridianimarinicoccus marinus TaxID=3231483 RepID=A0ABV3LAD4_9RHOB